MQLLMLAQQAVDHQTWAALRDSLRKEGEFAREGGMGAFLVIVLGSIALAVVVETVRRLQPMKGRAVGLPPRRLFQQAAKSLGIGRVNRFLLLRAAYAGRLEHPTVMFITPQLMERHAGEWADQFPIASLRRFLRARVNQVATALFGKSGATPIND